MVQASTAVTMPTANVRPPSRSARRPSALHSLYGSRHMDRAGVTCTR